MLSEINLPRVGSFLSAVSSCMVAILGSAEAATSGREKAKIFASFLGFSVGINFHHSNWFVVTMVINVELLQKPGEVG